MKLPRDRARAEGLPVVSYPLSAVAGPDPAAPGVPCPHRGDELTPAELRGVRCGRCLASLPEGDPAALVAEARALLSAATPGPWEDAAAYLYQDDGRSLTETFVRAKGDDVSLAVVVDPTTGYPHPANARLIARAPALLSALADALQAELDADERVCLLCNRPTAAERDEALARAERAERELRKARALSARALDAAESAVSSSDREWALTCLRKLHGALGSGEG